MDYRRNGAATTTSTITPNWSGTPDSDSITPAAAPKNNPFATPYGSMAASVTGSTTGLGGPQQRYFHSRRVRKGEVEKPWLSRKDPREKWVTIIPLIGIAIGVGLTGFLVYDGISSVTKHTYCSILDEDFSQGFNTDVWTREVETGGYGYVFSNTPYPNRTDQDAVMANSK